MDDLLKRLNKERLTCLAYTVPMAVAAFLAAVALYFTLSSEIKLDFKIPLVFFAVFMAAFVYAVRLFAKKHAVYEEDFIRNIRQAAYSDEYPGCSFDAPPLTVDDLKAAKLLASAESAVFSQQLRAVYEEIPFSVSHVSVESVFSGLFFVFEYDKNFKKYVQVRQKGFMHAKKAESLEGTFIKYDTGNVLFDHAFSAVAESSASGKAVLVDAIFQPFLDIKEKTMTKLLAAFDGNKLYILLHNTSRSIDIPLFYKADKENLKSAVLSETRFVMSLAYDLKLEKRIWNIHEPV